MKALSLLPAATDTAVDIHWLPNTPMRHPALMHFLCGGARKQACVLFGGCVNKLDGRAHSDSQWPFSHGGKASERRFPSQWRWWYVKVKPTARYSPFWDSAGRVSIFFFCLIKGRLSLEVPSSPAESRHFAAWWLVTQRLKTLMNL